VGQLLQVIQECRHLERLRVDDLPIAHAICNDHSTYVQVAYGVL
jgi:hypothetical protein